MSPQSEENEMKRVGFAVATIAAAAALAWSSSLKAEAAGNAKAEIEKLEHQCAAATSVDQLMRCYDSGDDLVVYDVSTPREFDGQKAVRGDFQNFFDTIKDPKVEFV